MSSDNQENKPSTADVLDPGLSLQRSHQAVLCTEPGKRGLCWLAQTRVSQHCPATGPQTFQVALATTPPRKSQGSFFKTVNYYIIWLAMQCTFSEISAHYYRVFFFFVIFTAIIFREWVQTKSASIKTALPPSLLALSSLPSSSGPWLLSVSPQYYSSPPGHSLVGSLPFSAGTDLSSFMVFHYTFKRILK